MKEEMLHRFVTSCFASFSGAVFDILPPRAPKFSVDGKNLTPLQKENILHRNVELGGAGGLGPIA